MKGNSIEIKLLQHLTGHQSAIYSLEKSSDQNKFWSGSGEGIVAEWNLLNDDGALLAKASGIVYSLKLLADKNILLVGQSNGGVHVINLKTNAEDRLLQFHTAPVFHIAYHSVHQLIFFLAGDGTLSIVNGDDFRLLNILKLSDKKLRSLAFHPSRDECVIGCGDGSIAVISLPVVEMIHRFQAHDYDFSVNCIACAADGKYLLSGSRDAHVNIFSGDDYSLIKTIPAHNYAIYDIAFHSSQKIIATASRDKTIKLWDVQSMNVLARLDHEHFKGHAHSVNKLLWMDDKLVSAGDDRSVLVWEIFPIA